jgi:predicted DNA-binding transcriptional regulator AlpA
MGTNGSNTSPAHARGRGLTDREAAPLLGVATSTLPTWRARHKGPKFVRLDSRSVRYFEADIEAWLQAHLVDPSRAAEEAGV